jgi:hypothetical protein
MVNSRVLCIPDLHFPYQHIDALDFLSKVSKKLQPDKIICGGDELDYHAMSFHNSDPDLDSAGVELRKGILYVQSLREIFPNMDLLHSNHGSMAYRKAKFNGMPRHLIKSYNELLEVDSGWSWHESIILEFSNGRKCKFVHSAGSNVLASSQVAGMSLVQFHYHSSFELRYWDGGNGLNFAITSGCLIDDKSIAFAYNKLHSKRPILGVTFIENGIPYLIPMVTDPITERWIGSKL